ncbi:hypothetical protein B7728_02065 [Streptococcus oralis subsp. tigurinus]|uniref:Nucleoside 2-deoxyribosyltransferase n=1 Tax=Streptococcus oralis subsp. tigurinus TaxID=1077464 RepID=A0A1X1G2Z7_STROR|nr:hypothetical protein [Streptococcus oralis]ORO41257.1 hypothetical protein B7728_02065 [Streptococcus oralis subsp. tigurinus]
MSKKTCFIVCPIGEDNSEIRKHSDTVLNYIITPALSQDEFDIIRVDSLPTVDRIDQTIIEYLQTADLVIADMTGHNANVFYEFGYRQALGKLVIPIIEEGHSIPFDVTTLRTIKYATNDLDKANTAINRLKEAIEIFDFESQVDDASPLSLSNIDSSVLTTINNKLDAIVDLLAQNNATIIDTVAEQVAKHSKTEQTMEERMLALILPEMIKNPESLNALANLGQKQTGQS